jgi:uncharacterized protein YceK
MDLGVLLVSGCDAIKNRASASQSERAVRFYTIRTKTRNAQ